MSTSDYFRNIVGYNEYAINLNSIIYIEQSVDSKRAVTSWLILFAVKLPAHMKN